MPTNELLLKIATADPQTLARVADVLNHKTAAPKPDRDLRTVTFTEGAKRLGFSRPTVYRLVKAGRLRTVQLNGVSRVTLESLEQFVDGK